MDCKPLVCLTLALAASLCFATDAVPRSDGLDFEELAALRQVGEMKLSPDGRLVAYTLGVPRPLGQKNDGRVWSELHVIPTSGGPARPYISGEVNVSDLRFTPDGRHITYRAKRGDDEQSALWAIPVDGGESIKLLEHDSGVGAYRLSPDGRRVAFLATTPETKERKRAKDNGYKQEVFEEDWRARRVWIAELRALDPVVPTPGMEEEEAPEPETLEIEGSVFDLEWSPDGERLALAVAPRPLIDDGYMLKRIRIVRVSDAEILGKIENPGKLGAFRFSPDGKHLAMITAADPNDPRAGRLAIAPASGGDWVDLMPDLAAHVGALAWRDASTLAFLADEREETRFGEVNVSTGAVRTLITSGSGNPLFRSLALSKTGGPDVFVGHSPTHPSEIFVMRGAESQRLTDSNPWLAEVELAQQEVVTFKARDGLELGGVLVHPLEGKGKAPLILMVHGGPEGHDRNGWVTSYSRPAQLAAARGFAVFYPNYRGSTGRGVDFSKLGQGDAAGKEFDDLVDVVDHLVATGIADSDRVGITGGSYGGYATAWCSTRYTDRFRAGVMFVGISNKLSKGFTTEIPVEDVMVHTRFDAWKKWQFTLDRSPLYHAEKSRTALLIAHGTADSRVHPSQSLQFYRALKLIGKTPVRYVRYPGEGHGNRKAAARDDYSRRLIRWMEHFLINGSTELPPWDLGLGSDSEEEDED